VRNIGRYLSLRDLAIVSLALVVSIGAGIGLFSSLKKEVEINDNGNKIIIHTMKETAGEVLEQSGIVLKPGDEVSVPLDMKLKHDSTNRIDIKRAVPVNVLVDGKLIQIKTCEDTVGEALRNSIEMDSNDRIEGAMPDDPVTDNMLVKVVRVDESIVKEEVSIPFEVKTRENPRMDKGKERVVVEGKEGLREDLYRVVIEDGKEVAREFLKSTLVSNPINKIVDVGTLATLKTSRGDTVRYTKVLDMRATAYTSSFKDTGKHPDHPEFGITYTGIRARRGIIAVDPRVIPLHTKVYVEILGDTPDYGFALAADTGGAIKGDLIDVYLDTQEEVDRWGVKRCRVYILADQ